MTQFALAEFSPVELRAMTLAGEITRHGIPGFDFYLPLGMVPDRERRAASLQELMRPGRVISGAAACWIHVGGEAPPQVELTRRTGSPLTGAPEIRCRYRRLSSVDVVTIASVRVTTPLRTLRDLHADHNLTKFSPIALRGLRRLADSAAAEC